MYKIPEEVQIEQFKDQVISEISFGLSYVKLFLDHCYIQFSGQFSIDNNGMQIDLNEVYPVNSDFGLLNVLEKKIIESKCNVERTILTLEIENNFTLTLFSDDNYESFEIIIDGKRIIV